MRQHQLTCGIEVAAFLKLARERKLKVTDVARTHFRLGDALRVPWLLEQIDALPVEGRWHAVARGVLRDELATQQRILVGQVLAMPGSDDLTLVVARATALNAMLATEDGTNLLQGLKRASKLLEQAEADFDGKVSFEHGGDPKFAETDAERALFAALDAAEPRIETAMQAEDFPAAMSAIAALRAPIDAFFEAVQVNTDNPVLRRNRLNLLHRIRETGRRIADFSRIEG